MRLFNHQCLSLCLPRITSSIGSLSPLEHRGSRTCWWCTLQALITEPGQVDFQPWAVMLALVPSRSRWKKDLTPIVRLQTFGYSFPGRCVIIKLSQGHAGWARKCYVTRDMCGIAEWLATHDTANLGRNKQLPWRPGTAARLRGHNNVTSPRATLQE